MIWIDIVIILILIAYAYDGWRRGFVLAFLELFGFIIGLVVAFRYFGPVSDYLDQAFHLFPSISKPIGFLVIWLLFEVIFFILVRIFYNFTPEFIRKSFLNKIGGILPSFLKGVIFIMIALMVLMIFPVSASYKIAVNNSYLGKKFVRSATSFEESIRLIFGGVIENVLTYFSSDKNQFMSINVKIDNLKVSEQDEAALLTYTNAERQKAGVKPLVIDPTIVEVARAHSEDMFRRKYFAHNTPDGLTPFDRMKSGGVKFLAAGENLAYAPTVELAQMGLMNSPEHRENILSPDYGRIGIGVIDAGVYGKMFTEDFGN